MTVHYGGNYEENWDVNKYRETTVIKHVYWIIVWEFLKRPFPVGPM